MKILAHPWAEVLVDGERLDTTPIGKPARLAPGRHELTFKHPNAPDERRTIDVAPGQRLTVEVEMEIGPIPFKDNTCGIWKTTYLELGIVKQVKDYKLCRGTGADDLYLDEGNGIRLAARIIGDSLVIPFKYDNLLIVSTTRLRGEVLEQEILTVEDKPAVKGALPMSAKGIQKLELRRVPVE